MIPAAETQSEEICVAPLERQKFPGMWCVSPGAAIGMWYKHHRHHHHQLLVFIFISRSQKRNFFGECPCVWVCVVILCVCLSLLRWREMLSRALSPMDRTAGRCVFGALFAQRWWCAPWHFSDCSFYRTRICARRFLPRDSPWDSACAKVTPCASETTLGVQMDTPGAPICIS